MPVEPKGQLAPPLTLTTAALDAFRKARVGVDHISVASVNRDLTAIQSLLRWLRHKRPNAISRPPRVDKFLEHDYSKDARHLEPAQWAALSTVPTARYAKFMPHDQHRRDQVARISAAYAQKMPAVEMVSPTAPQTVPPIRRMKARTGPARARTAKSAT